jgi:GntR family transcriptional regulator
MMSELLRPNESQISRRAEHERARRRLVADRHTSARRAYEQLRASIRSGRLDPESSLSEGNLVAELGASRNSVRRALQMLAEHGVVSRAVKVGTRSNAPIYDIPAGELLPLQVGPQVRASSRITSRLLHYEVLAAGDVGIPAEFTGRAVVRLEQVARDRHSPLFVRLAHLVVDDPCEFTDADPASVADRLAELDAGTGATSQRSRLSVEFAAGTVARLLRVPDRTVVLGRQLWVSDVSGQVREVSSTLFRADRVALSSWVGNLHRDQE